eukprot:8814358-Karenia_brevis.AAC.1
MGPTGSSKPSQGLFGTVEVEVKPKKLFAETAEDPSGEGKDESKDEESMSEEPGKDGGAAAPKKRPG